MNAGDMTRNDIVALFAGGSCYRRCYTGCDEPGKLTLINLATYATRVVGVDTPCEKVEDEK